MLHTKSSTHKENPAQVPRQSARGATRLSAAVYRELERQILCGELKPRERLTEMDFASRFRTSRTSIREAFRELELRHLVVATPNCGVTVREFTRGEIEDIYAVRAVVEELAARLAVRNATVKDIDEIERRATRFEMACRKKELSAMVATNRGFHEQFAAAASNRALLETMDDLRRKTFLVRNIFWSQPHHVERSVEDHAHIVEALRQRDEDAVVRLVMGHINMGRDHYLTLVGPA